MVEEPTTAAERIDLAGGGRLLEDRPVGRGGGMFSLGVGRTKTGSHVLEVTLQYVAGGVKGRASVGRTAMASCSGGLKL